MKPFEGIRVLDLTHVLAGPFSTYQLAVLGADVIKIESPHAPDMTREEGVDAADNARAYGSYFQSQSAGKRAIRLDLKSESGKAVMWKLIDSADVLVQNYAAGGLDKLGFSYDAVSKRNPLLIYCSISGFGRTGPKAQHPAYDVVIQAFSGLMAANGELDAAPVRVGPPMVDYGTGAQAALAISAALFQRQTSKKGQFIDVSMLDAALMLMTAHVKDALLTGNSHKAHGNMHPQYAGYCAYKTKAGLLMIGAWTNKQLASLFSVLGEKGRAQQLLETPRAIVHELYEEDVATISSHMLEQTADEWEQRLNDAHVPAAKVRTLVEALNSEQVKSRQVIQGVGGDGIDASNEKYSKFPVAAFSYEHGSPSLERMPPGLGEHTRELLQDIGLSVGEIDKLREEGVCV